MKKRILLLATVAALMALMLVATMAAAWAYPPLGSGTGCEAGQANAHHAIGTGDPSGARRAPYRSNPGEEAGGTGPDHGFDTSEGNTTGDNCHH